MREFISFLSPQKWLNLKRTQFFRLIWSTKNRRPFKGDISRHFWCTKLPFKLNGPGIERLFTWMSKSNWFVLLRFTIGLQKLAPLFHPIKCSTKTNRDSLTRGFPRFASATCIYYEFWLVLIFYVLCDWLEWLLSFLSVVKPNPNQLLTD